MGETHQFCCGGKNCPEIREENDGSVVIRDELANVPAMTTAAPAEIRFTRAQASELKEWLGKQGF